MSKKIIRKVGKAIHDFNLIEDGDNILVGMSGGKDSYVLLDMLIQLKKRAPIDYNITAITVEPGFEGFEWKNIEDYCKSQEIPCIIKHVPIDQIMQENKKENSSYCSFCARLRRGVLYTYAHENGYNKIALGHHGDDFIQTMMMNMFYNGQLKAMSPRHVSKDKRNIVIRPLAYVFEREIIPYVEKAGYPISKCECPYYYPDTAKREYTKNLVDKLEKENPNLRRNILSSLSNLTPDYFLNKIKK